MAANRLATNSQSWFDTISHQNGGASALQWISFEPRSNDCIISGTTTTHHRCYELHREV